MILSHRYSHSLMVQWSFCISCRHTSEPTVHILSTPSDRERLLTLIRLSGCLCSVVYKFAPKLFLIHFCKEWARGECHWIIEWVGEEQRSATKRSLLKLVRKVMNSVSMVYCRGNRITHSIMIQIVPFCSTMQVGYIYWADIRQPKQFWMEASKAESVET